MACRGFPACCAVSPIFWSTQRDEIEQQAEEFRDFYRERDSDRRAFSRWRARRRGQQFGEAS